MPPAKRDLSKMMWIWGGGAVVMFVACMVIANFFFPTAEESGYLEDLVREPQTTTYFHASRCLRCAVNGDRVCPGTTVRVSVRIADGSKC